jgi:putative addiction module killer protein
MFSLIPLPEFTAWFEGLDDAVIRGAILARLDRLQLGLRGDAEPVGNGISELRIHVGAGWRVYFIQRGAKVIVLLGGGSKRTQQRDIKRAQKLAASLD